MTPPAKPKKSGARGGARAGTRKAAPKKRRPRKKKTRDATRRLLLAFAAGLVLASALFWFGRDLSLPSLQDLPLPSFFEKEDARGVSQAQAPAGRGGGGTKRPEARAVAKTPAGGVNRSRDAAAPRAKASRAPAPAPPAASTASPAQGRRTPDATGSAVASALIDLQNLPYEESLTAPLDERIRQVDYALMQAAWMRRLPARAMRLALVEDRLEGVEPYQFQTIDVLPGERVNEFLASFRDCLDVWAEGAAVRQAGKDRWGVFVGEVQTHAIRLYPGARAFAPLPGQSPQQTPQPEDAIQPPPLPHPGMPQPRLRKTGEEARLVIVIDDLGASESALQRLLALDFPVTLAFWPHGAHTREGARAAHARGREILVHMPMEPLGYPRVKPGPGVLLTSMNAGRIRELVRAGIGAVPHAAGLNNHMGSRFTQQAAGVGVVLQALKEQGLFMLDSLTHNRSVFAREARRLGVASYRRNVFLDVDHSRAKVLEELRRAERIALMTGQAVAIGHPLPGTLAALKDWERLRDKRVRIVRLRDFAPN